MTTDTKPRHTPDAEKLADAILKAAGSGLRHYSMAKTREEIFAATQAGIDGSRRELLAALKELHEVAQFGVLSGTHPAMLKAAFAINGATGGEPTLTA